MLVCRVFPSQTFDTNMQIKTALFIAIATGCALGDDRAGTSPCATIAGFSIASASIADYKNVGNTDACCTLCDANEGKRRKERTGAAPRHRGTG
jgi:hypothetical protein